MSARNDGSGTAALSICEALLLATTNRNPLPEREIISVLKDAAGSCRECGGNLEVA